MFDSLAQLHQARVLVAGPFTPDQQGLVAALAKHHLVVQVASGSECLALAASADAPDLVVLDARLDDMDAYEVCRTLHQEGTIGHVPVIFWTEAPQTQADERALELGAVDLIHRPLSPLLACTRVSCQLKLKAMECTLREREVFIQQELVHRTRDLVATQDATVLVMASLAESGDVDTGNHIYRTQGYVHALARRLGQHPQYQGVLDEPGIELLLKATPLHDIGNVAIPDRILLKPARLTPAELDIMKTHTLIGRDIIERIDQSLNGRLPFLSVARQIALSHHEKWDGSGYPQGLAGEQIPLVARLMTLADVYDALISRRVYRDGLPHDKAVQIIFQGRATHFDPELVDAFIEIQDEFADMARRFPDTEQDLQQKMEYMVNAIAENP